MQAVIIMKELIIRKNDAGQRLDKYLGKAVPLLPQGLMHKYLRLKRIKRNKHVVVQLEGIAAVAIAFVPASYLREIDDP